MTAGLTTRARRISVVAEVVKVEALRDRADQQSIGDAVGLGGRLAAA
jgi:hypothetical protein